MTVARPVRIAAFGLACTLVVVLSLLPLDKLPEPGVSDKVEHCAAYAGLALLGAWAFLRRLDRVALGLIGGGISIELLQAAMPFNRQGDVIDALANSLGVALGMMLVLLILRRRR